MPWLSPTSSPDSSPRSMALYRLDPAMAPARVNGQSKASPSVTYIPSLIDGACGTMPNDCQRSLVQQLQLDLSNAIRLLPTLLRGAAVSPVDRLDLLQHTVLAFFEICVIVSAVPLLLSLPGALFGVWFACCCVLVVALGWQLNRNCANGEVIYAKAPSADGWTMGHDIDEERWFFAAGIGTSSKSLTKRTLPALARLFNRTIISVHAPTNGLPFDFLSALIQRSLSTMLPMRSSRALYAQIRTALLDSSAKRTVILAHNTGAITISHILRQLCADVPAANLSKLEIYTFGAAANNFTMPLGSSSSGGGGGGYDHHHHHQVDPKRTGGTNRDRQATHLPEVNTADHEHLRGSGRPHIEHFAFSTDPLARMGVLRSVQEDLEGRFCGSVFKLNCPSGAEYQHHHHHHHHQRHPSSEPQQQLQHRQRSSSRDGNYSRPLMSMADYLACLFPAASTSAACSEAASDSRLCKSILDEVLYVDRDLAEKREFAALAKEWASHRRSSGTRKGEKRLSWTGLGATANGMKGNMVGVMGLEMARKGCKECNGHRGSEVSWLARHVLSVSYVSGQFEYEMAGQKRVAGEVAEGRGHSTPASCGRASGRH
ncbi:hypothetical protein BD289DRAFT_453506 [Coniella lustricola]|uniref:Uncharacterized protein n=1 Tax=Coniella lustricola TaxID=2025994 RepID=A0A2T3A714_9PEZI|nr:hypothetical protein BD289DRAFT_453506 [Coniella lustricola]